MSVPNTIGISPAGGWRRPRFVLPSLLVAAIFVAALATITIRLMRTNDAPTVTVALPATTAFSHGPGAGGDALVPTVYIVTSAQVGDQLRKALGDADQIRYAWSLPPNVATVWVVQSDEEAVALEAKFIDGNSVLAGLGRPLVRVVR